MIRGVASGSTATGDARLSAFPPLLSDVQTHHTYMYKLNIHTHILRRRPGPPVGESLRLGRGGPSASSAQRHAYYSLKQTHVSIGLLSAFVSRRGSVVLLAVLDHGKERIG